MQHKSINSGNAATLVAGSIKRLAWDQQECPSKPMQPSVFAAPWNGIDAMARPIANALAPTWQVVTEDMLGASGKLGTERVEHPGKDRYTIGIDEWSYVECIPAG